MHSGMVNKTKYDYPRKLINQTNVTLKNLERNPPKNQSTIVETFYHIRIFEL